MILAVGDTHQNPEALKMILVVARDLKPEVLVHTGDNYRDFKWLEGRLNIPCYGVPGNCDYEDQPEELVFSYRKQRVLLVHGHQYGVKHNFAELYNRGRALKADLLIFGHTHHSLVDSSQSPLLVNPGSLTWPRGGSQPSFATIDFSSGEISAKIHNPNITFLKKLTGYMKTVF